MHLDYIEVEADDPLDEPGQRTLIWQLSAKGSRACSQGDLAVVELCAHCRARLTRKGDFVCSWSHQGCPPFSLQGRCPASMPARAGCVLTLRRVIRPRSDGQEVT